MAEVITDFTSQMSREDLAAMAVYLKDHASRRRLHADTGRRR